MIPKNYETRFAMGLRTFAMGLAMWLGLMMSATAQKPGFYKLADHVEGDTWDGVEIVVKNSATDEPLPVPLASVRISFRKGAFAKEARVTLDSAAGSILIEDAAGWHFRAIAQTLDLPAGTWNYDVETTDTNGRVKTYLAGTLNVVKQVTQ